MPEPDTETAKANLLRWTEVAADIYDALRALKLPEQLCIDLTFDWLRVPEDD